MDSCDYYQTRRYELHMRERPDSDYNTFYGRGWLKELRESEMRLYKALCDFEAMHGIPLGGRLLFTFDYGRQLAHMAPPTQTKTLADLEARGLVRVLDWGEPRTAGKHVRPRTVERVTPIPFVDRTEVMGKRKGLTDTCTRKGRERA